MTRDNIRRARTHRTAVIFASIFSILVAVTAVGFAGSWIANQRGGEHFDSTAKGDGIPSGTDGCRPTIPPDLAFVPPEPYPSEPPDLYQKEWYGTAALWTWLASEGEVWRGLPDEDADGRFTEKTFWWSQRYPVRSGSTPRITVTGRRLDRPGSFETGGRGGGFRKDIGSFMLVGIEIPAGCWELTATYGDAELSYVVSVKG